jgi:biopolymer transport protein ExbB/TolQ
MSTTISTFIEALLHLGVSGLLIPVLIVLLALVAFAIFCIASLLAEFFTERRHYKVNMPVIINDVFAADYGAVSDVIAKSALLKHQKRALLIVSNNMGLPADDLFALAKSEISLADDRFRRTVGRTDLISKVAPMFGLMCTLIPLGPGIVAMGSGDTTTLSSSLLTAFDGTVAGLVTAVVALFASRVRKRWYAQYLTALEALMTCVLQKADDAREKGIVLPCRFTDKELLDVYGAHVAKRGRGLLKRRHVAKKDSPMGLATESTVSVLPDEGV